eukprot:3527443-Prymnesium_polylepis.1
MPLCPDRIETTRVHRAWIGSALKARALPLPVPSGGRRASVLAVATWPAVCGPWRGGGGASWGVGMWRSRRLTHTPRMWRAGPRRAAPRSEVPSRLVYQRTPPGVTRQRT